MKLIIDVNLNKMPELYAQPIIWDADALIEKLAMDTSILDNNEEFKLLLDKVEEMVNNNDWGTLPEPLYGNAAEFTISFDEDTTYYGRITDTGTIRIIQHIQYAEDEQYLTVGFIGSRGAFGEVLTALELTGDNFEEKPIVYETSGPKDMYPWEDAFSYAERKWNNGYKGPMHQWAAQYVRDITTNGQTQISTAKTAVEFIKENSTAEEVTDLVDTIEAAEAVFEYTAGYDSPIS